MHSYAVRDAADYDGDLSGDSWRDDLITDYECDCPVSWTVYGPLSCEQVRARA